PSISSASHDFVCSIAPFTITRHSPSPPRSRSRRDPRCNIVWQKFDDDCHRCQHLSREVAIMNEQTNTTDQSQDQEESAYSLLIRSEEKSRNAFELIMYPCLILGPLIAIWQFAQHPVNIPAAGL